MAKPYTVIDVDSGASFGPFTSLALAEACVKRVRIKDWEIWNGAGACVDWPSRYQDTVTCEAEGAAPIQRRPFLIGGV